MLPGNFFRVLGLLALGLLGGCSSSPAYPDAVVLPEDQPEVDWSWATLGPHDVVRVVVYGHPEASTAGEGERVDLIGTIALPLIGEVTVGGLKPDEVRAELVELYSKYIEQPRVAVTVLSYGAREFYLLGHVENPGPFTLNRSLTALQALSYGGTFLSGALREEVLLFRRQEDRYDVHKFDASRPGPDGLVSVQAGDLIFVGRSDSGGFREEVLPYLQGAGLLASLPVGFNALTN
ncbi:MAG: polysaccharide biosynthesis/export family protein [Planctomycetota bacterium]